MTTNGSKLFLLLIIVVVVSITSITIVDAETPEVLSQVLTALIAYLIGTSTRGGNQDAK